MGFKAIKTELVKLSQQIEKWERDGTVTPLSKGAFINRMERIYNMVSDIRANVYFELDTAQQTPDSENNNAHQDDPISIIIEETTDNTTPQNPEVVDDIPFNQSTNSTDNETLNRVSSDYSTPLDTPSKSNTEDKRTSDHYDIGHIIEPIIEHTIESNDSTLQDSQDDTTDSNHDLINDDHFSSIISQIEELKNDNTAPYLSCDINNSAPKKSINDYIDQDLKQRIIRNLFVNEVLFYDNEIRKIDLLPTFEDALIYISEKYEWSPDSEIAQKFISIVEQSKAEQ